MVSRQISPVVFGEFTHHLEISLREINVFVSLTLDLKFNGRCVRLEGTGYRVIFHSFRIFLSNIRR